MSVLFGALGLLALAVSVNGEALTPPYFNLADGREILATDTCGEGVPEPELYCKLVGASAGRDVNVNLIQGQVCDICDPSRPDKRHPAKYAVDGAETWWQSPPLSRSMRLNEVNLTIDFGQAFHVAYVFIRMGNSPRPGVWALEKSVDYGATYTPWQYFADTPTDCEAFFGKDSLQPITQDDSVICDTQFSKVVPLEAGEIVVSLLNGRPSATNFFNSTVLQDWTRATNVRLRLMRTKTLLGHLMSVARQDTTVTRRYFYSIKDVSIGGRCMCNGHADTCDNTDAHHPYKLICRCQHNTCGDECDSCCDGFRQRAWQQSKANALFVCEPCNCYDHSDHCEYSAEVDAQHGSIDIYGQYIGGGVCLNCRHNTEGVNCNRCQKGYYRPFGRQLNASNVCERCVCDEHVSTGNCFDGSGICECRPEYQPPNCDSCSYGHYGYPNCIPCQCFLNGTRGYHCDSGGGSCPCKNNFSGRYCNSCAENFYDFPNCLPCDCHDLGTLPPGTCTPDKGECPCKNNFGGRSCNRCGHGYYSYPACLYCNCDSRGTVEEVCDKSSGKCLCKEGFGGDRCDQCIPGYYNYPDCKPCNCSISGSLSLTCDATGRCPCLGSFAGKNCSQCSPGYFKYPQCLPCECDSSGSIGLSCDASGKCQCKDNFYGEKCNSCKEGFYNFPACEDCNCDPAGVLPTFAGCGSVPPGELCQCKRRVQGRICNECRPLYWNLKHWNPEGCEECECHTPGVLGGIAECDRSSGQCVCKPGVSSRRCEVCKDGYYSLEDNNLFGCTDCGCDIGGADNNVCNKTSGQCPCRFRVSGRACDKPLPVHYFPTLYSKLQYEVEDGFTPARNPARYSFREDLFPNFSWKGYGVFSHLQNEILYNLNIIKPSLYRMVLRYVNLGDTAVTGTIKIVPENMNEAAQTVYVQMKPAKTPSLVTVAGPAGGIPSPLVMNPGDWTVRIAINSPVFVDYFVLLPAAFYEATVLEQRVENPCLGDENGPNLCKHFSYPTLPYSTVHGNSSYITDEKLPTREFYTDTVHLTKLGESDLPSLTATQPEIRFELGVTKPGPYVLIVSYTTPVAEHRTFPVKVETVPEQSGEEGRLQLVPCPYDTTCRLAVTDPEGRIKVFKLDNMFSEIIFKTAPEWNSTAALASVSSVPLNEWSFDYIRPQPQCVKVDGSCVHSSYPTAPDSTKVEFEVAVPNATVHAPKTLAEDTKTSLIFVDGENRNTTLSATAPTPGEYVIVVQYFQPSYPEFKVPVSIDTDNEQLNGELNVVHCPGNAGCRSVVTLPDGNRLFEIEENALLTLRIPENRDIYLDYLLLIPLKQFSEYLLEEELLDQTSLFISECGQDNFYIDVNTTGFCRDAVFSLTMDYFEEAQKCECNFEGSISFECEQFGGQCPCKDNVIGRRCEICKTGYYGFPKCTSCDCPTYVCDPNTGQCLCPPNVKGNHCEQCEEQTYGHDIIYGCEHCNCQPQGVLNDNMQCDLIYGNCQCKPNVVGRTCDRCAYGYWAYPHCVECACDLRGTNEKVCDQTNSLCFCKENVYGQACDLCKEGTFHISETNEKGCTECFCFGKTSRCSSSNLYRSQVTGLDDWRLATIASGSGIVTIDFSDNAPELLMDGSEPVLGGDFNDVRDTVMYFVAPEPFLGNKITAYGGNLSFTIFYTSGLFGSAIGGADVILQSGEVYLLYFSKEQPSAAEPFQQNLTLVESKFQLPTGFAATREQVMQALQSLTGIYIRGTYWESSITTRLSKVSLDIATSDFHPDAVHASEVEQCQCPPNYQGLSCEECAPGFYRTATGPFGGFCVPCKCNGHSDECDPVTGKCYNCNHNTWGPLCEFCETGYHGNATIGTPFDCLICACPQPTPSNNFATSCDVSEDGERISCNCKEGYYGARCESCSAGYYGRPEVMNDYCKPCNCSGNINPDDPASCNSITGNCTKCLNNTFGEACELCAPFFHGDAIALKDCRSCDCDTCGSMSCESYTGQCICHDNVIGESCDRCAPNHYGFKDCQGCKLCDCKEASKSLSCDDSTGQCDCQPGTVSRTCEKCAPGFWNYTKFGCESCGCNTNFSVGVGCNPATGQCSCLPGVIGERCDHCPYRWVLKPDEGCFECDSCTGDLLNTTDMLKYSIDTLIDDLQSFAGGYFTMQRLNHLNTTAVELMDKVTQLDPTKFDLKGVLKEVEDLEASGWTANRQAGFSEERARETAQESERVRTQALDLDELVRLASNDAGDAVLEVIALASSLESHASLHLDQAVQEAEEILNGIKDRTLEAHRKNAENAVKNATAVQEEMKAFAEPVEKQSEELENLRKLIGIFDDKLDDLNFNSQLAQSTAETASTINEINRRASLSSKVHTITNLTQEANDALENSRGLLQNASLSIADAEEANAEIMREKYIRSQSRDNLNASLIEISNSLLDLAEPVRLAQVHAEDLMLRARLLDTSLEQSRDDSGHGVKAARAYADIADNIKDANDAVTSSDLLAEQALTLTDGLEQRTIDSLMKSEQLLDNARNATSSVLSELLPQLTSAKDRVKEISDRTSDAKRISERLDEELGKTEEAPSLGAARSRAIAESDATNATTRDTLAGIGNIINKVPNEVAAARKLPKDFVAIQTEISHAKEDLDTVNTILPDINRLMDSLNDTRKRLERDGSHVVMQIERLKRQVAEARDLASRIRVGVTFSPNTYIQIKNPEDLEKQSTSTKVSAYFKTERENGALLYLGNEIGTSRKLKRASTDDYVAVELENGHPAVVIDLGSGPHRINSDFKVALNTWYQYIVERTGKHVKLTIKEEINGRNVRLHTNEAVLPGSASILNLDVDESKIYVGGTPVHAKVQPAVKYNTFDGQMEELMIGETPISLWNFKDAANNEGAHERDRLVDLNPSTGYRFNGNGFVTLNSSSYRMDTRNSISFKFKTMLADGLLFLVGRADSFLAIELRGGELVFKYHLGDGTTVLRAGNGLNDNQWHDVDASRQEGRGVLNLDGITDQAESPGSEKILRSTDTMYFGGYPGDHQLPEVTSIGFDGCIDGAALDGTSVDLSKNINAFGVTPGCPSKFATTVSFQKERPGYIKWPNATATNEIDLSLRFKSYQPDGIILLVSTRDHSDPFSIALFEGELVVQSHGGTLVTSNSPRYDDAQWHAITVTHDSKGLKLSVDDNDNKSETSINSPRAFRFANLLVGGVPKDYLVNLGKMTTTVGFRGCIADVTFNNVLVNFANATESESAIVGKCTDIDSPLQAPAPPIILPGKPREPKVLPTTTAAPKTTTTLAPPDPTPARFCALPLVPAADNSATFENNGYHFGTKNDSRLEITKLPFKFRNSFGFFFQFKTNYQNGIMFYGAKKNDRLGVYMKEGQVNFFFNMGSGTKLLTGPERYDDNQWHSLIITAERKYGRLVIDDEVVDQGEAPGNTEQINLNTPFYVGGVPPTLLEEVYLQMKIKQGFEGCIKGLSMNERPFSPPRVIGAVPCSDFVEPGAFFHSEGGYIKLADTFRVGQNIDIKMYIKPRSLSGVLLSVHSRKDYLLLQMVDGAVSITVDNGKGPISSTFRPQNKHFFCNGNWHLIHAVQAKSVVVLNVNSETVEPGISKQGSSVTDTKHPLFLGGVSRLGRNRGNVTPEQFVGCIRDVFINEKPYKLSTNNVFGNVTISACPTI